MQLPLTSLIALLPLAAQTSKVLLSNDDGWAEKNIRVFYDKLTAAGEDVVLCAPADNKSGSASSDATPSKVTNGCEFNSCPAGSPAIGQDSSNPRLNYVNSYPVTAVRYGIQNLSDTFFGGPPDIVVTGINVGANTGIATQFSGTVGGATEAALEGIPAIAFSGKTGSQVAWTTTTQTYQTVYADLSTQITQALLASGAPYLPSGIWLNVNFPAVSSSTCSSASQFKFVLSRVYSSTVFSSDDVSTCGSTQLPSEATVIGTSGCYASISVASASSKSDASATDQAAVLAKLQSILSCLP